MKSYFSRFLHHTMSYLGGKPDTSSSLSYSDLIGVSRSNQVANLSNLDHRVKPDGDIEEVDTRVKPDGDSVCAGRSMVEMLGVLAIIGVLSVGAIAGYGKAMEKYKINKMIGDYNMFIGGLMEYYYSFNDEPTYTALSSAITKINLLPANWKFLKGQGSNGKDVIADSYGNWINPFIGASKRNDNSHVIVVDIMLGGLSKNENNQMVSSAFAGNTCFEIFKGLVLPLREHLLVGYVYREGASEQIEYYGDDYCGGENACLSSMSLEDVKNICDSCDKNRRCNITIAF